MSRKVSEEKYTGEKKNGKPHGTGRCEYENGEIYDGEWKDGIHDGFGTYITNDGCRYMGQFKNGKYNGYGTMYASNDEVPDAMVISGQWVNGDAEGIAVVFGEEIKGYAGQISEDRLTGVGCSFLNNGIRVGKRSDDDGYSFSLLYRNDGITSLVSKKDGELHGKQINFCSDGSQQVSKYSNGIKDKISYIELQDGTTIIGEMDENGVLDGEISLLYPDGRKLKRHFIRGTQIGDWIPEEY